MAVDVPSSDDTVHREGGTKAPSMPDKNKPLLFDFAKDFDREDEARKRAESQARRKASAEARQEAEEFGKALRRIVRENQRQAAGKNDARPKTPATPLPPTQKSVAPLPVRTLRQP